MVTARLEHELAALKKRIHILEGFEKIFDALDEVLRIVRKSDGKADAAEKIMKRFGLDAEQTDAILELKIYRLARLEILVIQQELDEKRKRARQIGGLLKNEESRWKLVREELEEIQKTYGDARLDKRRTLIEAEATVEYTADDFIVEEDNIVIVSRDGWVKRQKEVKDLSTTRLREGDAVLAVLAGQHTGDGGVLHQFRHAPTPRASSMCPHPRVTASRCRACSSSRTARGGCRGQPRSARGDRHQGKEGRRRAAAACGRRDERRLQPAVRPRAVRRSQHARRAPVRPRRSGRGGRRRVDRDRRRSADCGHAAGPCAAVQGRTR